MLLLNCTHNSRKGAATMNLFSLIMLFVLLFAAVSAHSGGIPGDGLGSRFEHDAVAIFLGDGGS